MVGLPTVEATTDCVQWLWSDFWRNLTIINVPWSCLEEDILKSSTQTNIKQHQQKIQLYTIKQKWRQILKNHINNKNLTHIKTELNSKKIEEKETKNNINQQKKLTQIKKKPFVVLT